MLEHLELSVQRVSHLAELLRPPDHVGHHDLHVGPGQVLVHSVPFHLGLHCQVVSQPQQLGITDPDCALTILEQPGSVCDCILVVGGYDDLAHQSAIYQGLEAAEVVLGGFLEAGDDRVFVVVLPGQSLLFNDVGTPH